MTFRLPSPAAYFGSLLIAAPVAYLLYWVLQPQNMNNTGLITLAAGLLTGHLIGACSQSKSSRASVSPQIAAQPSTSLYVGNLAYRAQRSELHDLFSKYGSVNSVRIMIDRVTRRPRGYAFIEMESIAAKEALNQLDNTEFAGRNLRVSEAKLRQEKS